ncbi:hypothetical protein B0T24DRAFT_701033 [Lasiosphaeria ovina]|uniref:F-box domain-containing protein n=1 Tax=Lasiosphaeria ovina TaxID=92902 RepID=A0AAE0KHQ9_9PEZI|nr:hypothetical protein B0T24DRAFT_701033 [Lasiosphaeria ovina]
MELMNLPPELLLQVFGHVGAKSFRQDLGRLTVSRHWYSYAWPVLVGDIRLTATSLLQFTADETLDLFLQRQPHIATLELNLTRNQDWTLRMLRKLGPAVERLATVLHWCAGLRTLTVRLRRRTLGVRGKALVVPPLADLLSFRHLTSLDFDAVGFATSHDQAHASPGPHACALLNGLLLTSLRRLRCRLDRVCDALLVQPWDDAPTLDTLEELVVNLRLHDVATAPGRHPGYRQAPESDQWSDSSGSCYPHQDTSTLRAILASQASALAARMARPRVLLLVAEIPFYGLWVFNALTGDERRRRHPGYGDVPWDDEIFAQS